MRIGGKTADEDDDVAALERLLFEEYALSGVIHEVNQGGTTCTRSHRLR